MILRDNPYRLRNFLLRNNLYFNRKQCNIDRIRNHYRIPSDDIHRINAQIVVARRYATKGRQPNPPGRRKFTLWSLFILVNVKEQF